MGIEHYSEIGADVYIMGALITENGYQADTTKMKTYAKKFNILVAMANHIEPIGDWQPVGKSAIWSSKGLLASADETQQALVIAERLKGIWSAQVIDI